MSTKRERLLWFAVIYGCSVIIYAFITFVLRVALRLL
jgi:hypothetical protein